MAKEESGLQKFGRNVGSTALKALGNLETLGQVFDPVNTIVGGLLGLIGIGATGGKESAALKATQLGGELGFEQNTPQLLESSQILPQDYLTPRSGTEKFIQNVGSQAPFAGLSALSSGSRILPAILPNILGNVASQGAEAVDIGELGQMGAQLGTELATGAYQGGFRPGGLKNKAKGLYNRARSQLPENALTPGQSIAEGINNLEKTLQIQTDPKIIKNLDQVRKTISGLLTGSEGTGYKVNPIQALDTRINLNKHISDSPNRLKRLLIPIKDSLNEAITDAAVQYPLAINDIKAADQIYTARNIPNKLTSFIDRNRDKIPTKTLQKTTDLFDVVQKALWQPVKGYKMISQFPEVMKYYKEMGKAASKNNFVTVSRFADKINDIVKRSEEIDDSIDLDSIF